MILNFELKLILVLVANMYLYRPYLNVLPVTSGVARKANAAYLL